MKQYRKKPNFERTEGLHVIVRDNNVDKAMRKLKRMVKNAGILQEIKERQFFQKPSEKKKRILQENIKRVKKLNKLKNRI